MNKEKTNINKHINGIITYTIEITWLSQISTGWGNGYIAIPQGHKWYGKDYDYHELPSIHYGWTYAAEETIEDKKYWVFGFDTCHLNDTMVNWPQLAVVEEIEGVVYDFLN